MLDGEGMQRAQVAPVVKESVSSIRQPLVRTDLQVVVKYGTQWAITLRQSLAESRGIGISLEAQYIERSQQRAPFVVGRVQIHDLAHGRVRIAP